MEMTKLVLQRSGTGAIEVWTCVPGAEAIAAHQRMKNDPGGVTGKPIWVWETTPPGKVIGVDFTNAIVCQTTAAQTQVLVNAFKANPTVQPEDVLIYE